jgi:dipeptidyl aminopeptidase/acylaminoacyl peptidase
MPSASADGTKLVFRQTEPANSSVRLRHLSTGSETTLISALRRPALSPDGSFVAYSDQKHLSVIPAAGGEAAILLKFERSGDVFGWSPDSRRILYWDGEPVRYSAFGLAARKSTVLVSHPSYSIHDASLSPDQRGVAFHTPLRNAIMRIAPVRNGRAAGEAEWVTLDDRGVDNRKPWWSPDGNLLYFFSMRDGFACIYAQRLEPASKRPIGEPVPVYHFHRARVRAFVGAWLGPAILPDRIILSLTEGTSNVWLAEAKK